MKTKNADVCIVFFYAPAERSTAVGLSGLALPNDLSTTSPARASGSASLFLRTAREADVHLNTYTDVRRRRRCSFVSPDRRRSLVVPHGAYVGELTCTACV